MRVFSEIFEMSNEAKLTFVKTIHTLVWLFFNLVIFYMLYAALVNKLDMWLWMGYGLFLFEAIVLIIFKSYCPLTLIARKYSDSHEPNFDIYLPERLAEYNKWIYSTILIVIVLITLYQFVK